MNEPQSFELLSLESWKKKGHWLPYEWIGDPNILLLVIILVILVFLAICIGIFYCQFYPNGIPEHLKEDPPEEEESMMGDEEKKDEEEKTPEEGDKAMGANGNGTEL